MQLLNNFFGLFTREKYATQKNITKSGNWFYGFDGLKYYFDGLSDGLDLYKTNPALNLAVGRLAQYVSDATFYIDVNGEKDFTNPITTLLNKPNEYQSKQDFIRQWVIYTVLYGYSFVYDQKRIASSTPRIENTSALWVINPKYSKTFKRSFLDILLDKNKEIAFSYTEDNNQRNFDQDEVIRFYDGCSGLDGDFFKGHSRVKALQTILDNVRKATEGENVILGQPGGFGIISNQTTDNISTIGFHEGEKEAIEAKLSNNGKYGVQHGQSNWIVSEKNLKVQPFNSHLKDYTYNENYKQNLLKVGSAFGIPKELLGFDDSTYENKEVSEVQFYTNTCQNYIDQLTQSLSNYYQLSEPIRATYEFVPNVAKAKFEAKKSESEHIKEATQICYQLLMLGVKIEQIEEQYKELTGYEIEIDEKRIRTTQSEEIAESNS